MHSVSLSISHGELHPVRMPRQHRQRMQHHILHRIRQGDLTGEVELACLRDRGQPLLHLVRQDLLGLVTFQAQQGSREGAMPLARGSQGAIKINTEPGHGRKQTGLTQLTGKHRPGPHRPHRVGTRRTNAHREQIENTNSHSRDPFQGRVKQDKECGGRANPEPRRPGPRRSQCGPPTRSLCGRPFPSDRPPGRSMCLRRGAPRRKRGFAAKHAVRTAHSAASPRIGRHNRVATRGSQLPGTAGARQRVPQRGDATR
ncbi:hypothetical protein PJL18_02844 [Paenarthrobacter nicotinovorans]|nr:hypothetical protein [Paenarthrobacter nicotinovorans]